MLLFEHFLQCHIFCDPSLYITLWKTKVNLCEISTVNAAIYSIKVEVYGGKKMGNFRFFHFWGKGKMDAFWLKCQIKKRYIEKWFYAIVIVPGYYYD